MIVLFYVFKLFFNAKFNKTSLYVLRKSYALEFDVGELFSKF